MSMTFRVLHVNLHSCIRVFKISWCQLVQGKKVHLATERINNGHEWKDFHGVHAIHTGHWQGAIIDKQQFGTTIEQIAPIFDVIHVHNEPDWITHVVRQATDKPIIWDVHDMVSVRTGKPDEDEEAALRDCSGVSCVSREYVENISKRTEKPVEEVLSCVPGGLFPKERSKIQFPGIVYEGGLRGVNQRSEQLKCRSWADTFSKLTSLGVPVWAYNNFSGEDLSNFKTTIVMGPLPYRALLQNLTAYEAGLVGSPEPDPMFDGALPNKLFEYIAAGLPIIVMNAPTVSNFVEAFGLGVTVSDVTEIPDALNQINAINESPDPDQFESLKDYIWKLGRLPFTMESQLKKVDTLYSKVTGRDDMFGRVIAQ